MPWVTFCRAAWTEQQALCMRRDALLACLEAAKEAHSKLWARTSIEMAFEVLPRAPIAHLRC